MTDERGVGAQPQLLAITMGDACGIGPEIIAKLHAAGGAEACVVIGDPGVLLRAVRAASLRLAVAHIDAPGDLAAVPPNCIAVIMPEGLPADVHDAPVGQVDVRAGRAAIACIAGATRLALSGAVAGIVTAPVHKEALSAAGSPYPGHTEMLQALAAGQTAGGVSQSLRSPGGSTTPLPPVRMMLANDELCTVLVTIHTSLRSAIDAVTYDAVLETIVMAHAALAPRYARPRIAVAGLNPHAGEGGLFGDEEVRIIAPAVAAARAAGIDASGPYAPDTVFMRARNAPGHPGEFDAVVAMTHDHGLIPVKYLGVADGVNVTLGLPFVRTSPDHGTAFDIAGRGVADAASLGAAVRMARKLVR